MADSPESMAIEVEELRKQVRDLKRPPRGIGGQVITVADCNPTYADLLGSYHRMETEYGDMIHGLMKQVAALKDVVRTLEVSAAHPSMDGHHQAKTRWGVQLTPDQWAVVADCG